MAKLHINNRREKITSIILHIPFQMFHESTLIGWLCDYFGSKAAAL